MSEFKLDAPEVKKLVDDAVAAANQEAELRIKDTTTKLTSVLNEVKSLKIKLKDNNPDEIAELRQKIKDSEDKKRQQTIDEGSKEEAVKELQDRLTAMVSVHEKENTERDTKYDNLKTSYIGKTSRETVLEALAARKVSPDVMLNNILPLIETTVDGENWNTIVKNADGTPRVDVSTQTPFTLKNLLDEMSLNPAFAPNFPQAGGGGGGAGDGDGGASIGGVTKWSDLDTFEKKDAYLEKHGQEATDKLCAAGK